MANSDLVRDKDQICHHQQKCTDKSAYRRTHKSAWLELPYIKDIKEEEEGEEEFGILYVKR